jgi:hypothetical protein
MKGVIASAVALCSLVFTSAAFAGDVVMFPNSSGSHTVASWRAQEGLPDTVGAADQALWLASQDPDGEDVAAATFNGVEGVQVQAIKGLEWEHRAGSDCGKFSPRWTLTFERRGKEHVVRLGCAASIHSQGSAPGWIRDTNTQAVIRAQVLKLGGKDLLFGTVTALSIVYDVRGPAGYSVLDNIEVTASPIGFNRWTSAADNAAVVPGPPKFVQNDRLAQPFSDFELMPFDDLWGTLSDEERGGASADTLAE